jgi:hypothetical protein
MDPFGERAKALLECSAAGKGIEARSDPSSLPKTSILCVLIIQHRAGEVDRAASAPRLLILNEVRAKGRAPRPRGTTASGPCNFSTPRAKRL